MLGADIDFLLVLRSSVISETNLIVKLTARKLMKIVEVPTWNLNNPAINLPVAQHRDYYVSQVIASASAWSGQTRPPNSLNTDITLKN